MHMKNDPQVIDEYGFLLSSVLNFSLTEHTIMPIAVVISSDKLNSLGEEGKKIMIEAAEAARTAARAVADSTIEKAYQGIEEQGGFVNKVDNIEDFRNVVLPVIDNYKEKYGKEGAEIIELILE
jgi:TRAP-type C4-dicarboxylate transport system substrate-binding protein